MSDIPFPNGGQTMPVELNRQQSFLVCAMAYWEALSSFLVDQKLDENDYLTPFCKQRASDIIYPNPWTGISTPLYVLLGKLGALIRQKRLVAKVAAMSHNFLPQTELQSHALQQASKLEDRLLQYAMPPKAVIEDTGDPLTSKIFRRWRRFTGSLPF
jgi:hypothetical protein